MKRLHDIEARLKAATPGPWLYMGDTYGFSGEVIKADGMEKPITVVASTPEFDQRDEDMELIAHAPEDLSYLLDLVTAQQERIKALEGLLVDARDAINEDAYNVLWDAITNALEGANR